LSTCKPRWAKNIFTVVMAYVERVCRCSRGIKTRRS